MNPYAPPTTDLAASPLPAISVQRAAEIRRRISQLSTRSFLLGVPGLLFQVLGNATDNELLLVLGVGLLIAGVAHYALMRGRHPAFGLLGIMNCLGLAILALLPKKCLNCATSHSFRKRLCERCGAPLGP